MKERLSLGETSLVGNWLTKKDGSVIEDSVCERIRWLTESVLELVIVDGDNWSALYKNPDNNSYWELTYPKSYMHGGGPPTLTCISEEIVSEKYDL